MPRIILYLCFLLAPLTVFTQELEFGLMAGASGYIGDINPDNPFKFTDPAFGAFFKYNLDEFHGFRFNITQAKIRAADADARDRDQQLRNLSFESAITEISVWYEFNFLPFIPKTKEFRLSPYTFAGFSVLTYNPRAKLGGTTYNLRDLHTEGQGIPGNTATAYGLFTASIPYGAGIKFNFVKNFSVAAELGYRYCFSDYLDDVGGAYADNNAIRNSYGETAAQLADRSGEVNNGQNMGREKSQRGDNRTFDQFMTTTLSLTYTVIPYRCPDLRKVHKRNYFSNY